MYLTPAPSKLHDYLRANHHVGLAATSTDVFGCAAPEAVASNLLSRWQPLSQLDRFSTPLHRKCHNDQNHVGHQQTCPLLAALDGSPRQQSRRAPLGGPPQAGSPGGCSRNQHGMFSHSNVLRCTQRSTAQNPLVMGTKPRTLLYDS